jgi:hypothetical protein
MVKQLTASSALLVDDDDYLLRLVNYMPAYITKLSNRVWLIAGIKRLLK